MDKKNIIQQGTKAKYLLTVLAKNFDTATMDFVLTLRWNYRGITKVIHKSDMVEASGGFLFELDTTDIIGKVAASCKLIWPDTDVSGGERPDVDDQWLCVVVDNPCPSFISCPKCDAAAHVVKYERKDESDIGEKYERVVDVYDRPLLTSDDEYIYVLRGEEE